MNPTLEILWNEYFAEKCAELDTNEERALVKEVAEMHKSIDNLLTKEQSNILEKYIETLHQFHACECKKAFFKGCGITAGFLFEVIGKIN